MCALGSRRLLVAVGAHNHFLLLRRVVSTRVLLWRVVKMTQSAQPRSSPDHIPTTVVACGGDNGIWETQRSSASAAFSATGGIWCRQIPRWRRRALDLHSLEPTPASLLPAVAVASRLRLRLQPCRWPSSDSLGATAVERSLFLSPAPAAISWSGSHEDGDSCAQDEGSRNALVPVLERTIKIRWLRRKKPMWPYEKLGNNPGFVLL
jgi:hypothetical protein